MASPTENYLNVVVPNFVSGQGHFVFKEQAPFRVSVGYGFFADHGITPAVTLGHMLSHIIVTGESGGALDTCEGLVLTHFDLE